MHRGGGRALDVAIIIGCSHHHLTSWPQSCVSCNQMPRWNHIHLGMEGHLLCSSESRQSAAQRRLSGLQEVFAEVEEQH